MTYDGQHRLSSADHLHPAHFDDAYPSTDYLQGTLLPQIPTKTATSTAYRPSGFGAMSAFDPIANAPSSSTLAPIGTAPQDIAAADSGPGRVRELSSDSGIVANGPSAKGKERAE